MSWFLAYLAAAAARPSVILTLLALAGLVLLFAGRRSARWWLLAGIGGQSLLIVLPVDQWIARPLEDWYPQVQAAPAQIDGIVLLGGATQPLVAADRGTPGLNSEAERMTAFAVLAQRHPEARLVFTGGAGSILNRGVTESAAARTFFAASGLGERMTYEERSDNTWENARLTRQLMAPKPGETWLLVTSAIHMPRSMAAFRAAGWTGMLPYPTAYHTRRTFGWAPSFQVGDRLALLDEAVHEWIGMAVYRVRGRAEFPAPSAP